MLAYGWPSEHVDVVGQEMLAAEGVGQERVEVDTIGVAQGCPLLQCLDFRH